MKFSCPKCETRYSVADEKVPQNRTLRFTCKKCENVFRLRRRPKTGGVQTGEGTASPTPAPAAGPAPQRAPRVETAAPKARERNPRPIAASESTRVAKLDEILTIKERSRDAAPTPDTPFLDQNEWFVLINGKQDGPLTANEVLKMFSDGKIDKRTYAWRDGMADWLRLGTVPEFSDIAQKAGDASWRVVRPIEESTPAALENTVSMNIGTLRNELKRLDDEEPGDAASLKAPVADRMDTANTGVMNSVQLEDALAQDAQAHQTRPMEARELQAEIARSKSPDHMARTQSEIRPLTGEYTDPDMIVSLVDGDGPALRPAHEAVDNFDPFQPSREQAPLLDEPGFSAPAPVSLPGFDAPMGEATRVFMATAGIFKRRRRQRIAAVLGIVGTVLFIAVIAGDLSGAYEIPGMGLVYAGLDIEDANVERAIKVTQKKLARSTLSPAEKKALRDKLLGLNQKVPLAKGSRGMGKTPAGKDDKEEHGVADTKTMTGSEADFLAGMMSDQRKREVKVKSPKVTKVDIPPDLPEGLTGEVLKEEINKNSSAIKLCITEAMRAGEPPKGKMEVAITIHADGRVREANIETDKFKGSTVGKCTVRYAKRWRFPRFNGKPVDVVFPYVFN